MRATYDKSSGTVLSSEITGSIKTGDHYGGSVPSPSGLMNQEKGSHQHLSGIQRRKEVKPILIRDVAADL